MSLVALELAKLAETSYFGALIAFAQELNRGAEKIAAEYREVTDLFDKIDFPAYVRYQPGVIGGHCAIPNLSLFQQVEPSLLLQALLDSNRRWASEFRIEGRNNRKSESS